MSNSLNPTSQISQQKILSTQNSRNSTFTALNKQSIKADQNEASFRLFTFMNVKNDERFQLPNKAKNNRKKSVKKISQHNLKKDSSGLINMIQQSRKKREDFYRLILDSDSLTNLDNNNGRKCKTPTNIHINVRQKSSSNNCSMTNINYKNAFTPRSKSIKNYFHAQPQPKPKQKKFFQGKSSCSQLSIKCQNIKQQGKKVSVKNDKIAGKFQKQKEKDKQKQKQKNDELALLKKKKDLQKQLLQINQILMLAHNKKRTKQNKTRK